MDILSFILYFVGVLGGLIIGGLSLWTFGVKPQTKKLTEESRKLQLKINQLRSEVGEGGGEIIKGALSDIGIGGILQELDIDPSILKNPFVRGIIDKYAPKVLEQLSKGGKNANDAENTGNDILL